MGYDIHICRGGDVDDEPGLRIALQEWLDYVASDSEMRLDNVAVAPLGEGEGELRYENEGLAVWTAFSGHDVAGNQAWFDFRNGRIVVKNAPQEIRAKMFRVSAALNARVVGDEGEYYGADGNESGESAPMPVEEAPARRSFAQRWMDTWYMLVGDPATRAAARKFSVGTRVRDPWGNEGHVIAVSPSGVGAMKVRYDSGREVTLGLLGDFFTVVDR